MPRDLEEEQSYEYFINKKQETNLEKIQKIENCDDQRLRKIGKIKRMDQKDDGNCDHHKKIQTPRRSQKYVFFDIDKGRIVFEWGGIQQPMFFKVGKQQVETEIYPL